MKRLTLFLTITIFCGSVICQPARNICRGSNFNILFLTANYKKAYLQHDISNNSAQTNNEIALSDSIREFRESDSSYKYWMTLGLNGIGQSSLHYDYAFSFNNIFMKVGQHHLGGLLGEVSYKTGYSFHSLDILVGLRIQSKWFQSSLFAGIAYLRGEKILKHHTGDLARSNYQTIGLQIDGQSVFRIANEIGIGIGLYANFNMEKNFSGINIKFTIGNGK